MSDIVERLAHADEYEPLGNDAWEAADEIIGLRSANHRLREEIARLREQNTELMLRAHALLWLLPPEITCGELQKARDEMLAATIREGEKDE